MLGPPLAAWVGITFWGIVEHWKTNHILGWLLTALVSAAALVFEIFIFRGYPDYSSWVTSISLLIWLSGIGLLAISKSFSTRTVSMALVLIALLVAPFTWSVLTVLNTNPNVALPTAGLADSDHTRASNMTPNTAFLNENGQAILDYTLANTDPDAYLLAANNARDAAPFILGTGRAVLTFGGFTGGDDVINLADLVNMIESGELRYILGIPGKAEIARWVVQSCVVADVPGIDALRRQPLQPQVGAAPIGQRDQQNDVLYDCGN
jgi:hypothetical protein